MRILVTGGAGFVGSHLVEALVDRHPVIVLDDFSSGRLTNLSRVRGHRNLRIVRGTVNDSSLVRVVSKRVDAVFHLAAKIVIPQSLKDPKATNRVNVDGTLNLLSASVKNHVRRLIYASSCSVYGRKGAEPIHETQPPSPLSPYAASKLAAESYSQAFHEAYGLETVILRYFNVYGPRQIFSPYSNVITRFIERARKRRPLIVFGNGRQTRDFVFVSDIVRANLQAMKSDRAVGKVFNVGTGTATTVSRLAQVVLELFPGTGGRVVRRPPRAGDIKFSCANISRAARILGYHPRVGLKQGLRRIVNPTLTE